LKGTFRIRLFILIKTFDKEYQASLWNFLINDTAEQGTYVDGSFSSRGIGMLSVKWEVK
jgi:hypothetical protein